MFRGHDLTNKIGLDRQFAVLAATVDQYGELDLFRAAEIHKLVESGADRPAGVEDIVDEDDYLALEVFFQFGPVDDRAGPDRGEIVAVERDIDYSVDRGLPFQFADLIADAFGERHAAAADADNVEVFRPLIRFYDL